MDNKIFTKSSYNKLKNSSDGAISLMEKDDEFLKHCYQVHNKKLGVDSSEENENMKKNLPKVNVSAYAKAHNISRETARKRLLGIKNQGFRKKRNFVLKHRDKILDILYRNDDDGMKMVKHVYQKMYFEYNVMVEPDKKIKMCSYGNFLKHFREDLELMNLLKK